MCLLQNGVHENVSLMTGFCTWNVFTNVIICIAFIPHRPNIEIIDTSSFQDTM